MATIPAGSLCISGWGQSAGFKFLSPSGVDLGEPASAPTAGGGSGIQGFQALKPSGHIATVGAGVTFPNTSVGLWNASDFTVRAEMTDFQYATGKGIDVDDNDCWYGLKTKVHAGSDSIVLIFKYDKDANVVQSWELVTGPKNDNFSFNTVAIGVNGAGTKAYIYGRQAGFTSGHSFPPKVYEVDLAGSGTWNGVFADEGLDYTAGIGDGVVIGLTTGDVLVAWLPQAGPGYIKRYNAAGVEQQRYDYGANAFDFDPLWIAHGLTESTFWVGAYGDVPTYSAWRLIHFDVTTGSVLHEFVPEDGEFQFDSAFTVLRVSIGSASVPVPPISTSTVDCHDAPLAGGSGQTGPVLPPSGAWAPACAGNGDVPTGADATDSEDWS